MSRPFEKSKALFREVKQRRKTVNQNIEKSLWIPHPRTGIYYPKGYEWVMDDVPNGAATFKQTYWFRNLEGTDKPIAEDPSNNVIFDHPFLNM